MENNLEEALGSILSNPEMMQKIQSMAQMLGNATPAPSPRREETQKPPEVDLSSLQRLAGLAGQTGIDSNQKALLSALSPYLSKSRDSKLENAMRAAKMARLASVFLGNGGLQSLTGRESHV